MRVLLFNKYGGLDIEPDVRKICNKHKVELDSSYVEDQPIIAVIWGLTELPTIIIQGEGNYEMVRWEGESDIDLDEFDSLLGSILITEKVYESRK